jgi:hypothetical protein
MNYCRNRLKSTMKIINDELLNIKSSIKNNESSNFIKLEF